MGDLTITVYPTILFLKTIKCFRNFVSSSSRFYFHHVVNSRNAKNLWEAKGWDNNKVPNFSAHSYLIFGYREWNNIANHNNIYVVLPK